MFEILKGIWIGDQHDCQCQMPTIHLCLECDHFHMDATNMAFMVIDDLTDGYRLLSILEHADTFITHFSAIGKGVLVHCVGGFFRSPTLVLLYLMKHQLMTPDEFATRYPRWEVPEVAASYGHDEYSYWRVIYDQANYLRYIETNKDILHYNSGIKYKQVLKRYQEDNGIRTAIRHQYGRA